MTRFLFLPRIIHYLLDLPPIFSTASLRVWVEQSPYSSLNIGLETKDAASAVSNRCRVAAAFDRRSNLSSWSPIGCVPMCAEG